MHIHAKDNPDVNSYQRATDQDTTDISKSELLLHCVINENLLESYDHFIQASTEK